MTSDVSYGDPDQIAVEQATNGRYQGLLEALRHRQPVLGVPRNAKWAGGALPRTLDVTVEALVGRVALLESHEWIDTNTFYIGPRYIEDGDLLVFSWIVPAARAFFDPEGSEHEFCGHVGATRTLMRRALDVVGYVDDEVRPGAGDSPFRARRALSVPTPPSGARRAAGSRASVPRPPESPPIAAGASSPSPAPQVVRVEPPPTASAAAPKPKRKPLEPGQLRAETAVLAALAAPREQRLTSALATLQPDQYDLVSRDPRVPVVIQGHPGTGKTVIAAHRAAFLTHEDRGDERLGKVLLVGPTANYADHVVGILADLGDPDRIDVWGLEDLLLRMRAIPGIPTGPADGSYTEVQWDLGITLEAVVESLIDRNIDVQSPNPAKRLEQVYLCARSNSVGGDPVVFDEESIRALKELPSFPLAAAQRRYTPLLAAAAASLGLARDIPVYDHIIVDEAQDVRPLEWFVLRSLVKPGQWSILGDTFQRRSNWSCRDWNEVIEELELTHEGRPIEPEVVGLGYRSTRPIIAFANQLLPAAARRTHSLQPDGPQPSVHKVSAAVLPASVVDHTSALCDSYPTGTVAIITMDTEAVARRLRGEGWLIDPTRSSRWVKDARAVSLLPSEAARGLEFDGVVVVEPADFPENLGHRGQLFTSLTRANRELVVVHSKGLPGGLRAPARGARPPAPAPAPSPGS